MKPQRFGLIGLLFLWTMSPAAADEPAPHFDAQCKLGKHEFKVSFVSKSGDPMDDDMSVSLVHNGGSFALPVKPDLYYPAEATTEAGSPKSVCGTIAGFAAGADRALLFLTRDQRPGYPVLTVVLVDLARNKVLSEKEALGEFKRSDEHGRYIVRRGKTGWHVRLVREVLKSDTDGAENYIEDWNVIEVHGDRIMTAWRDPMK